MNFVNNNFKSAIDKSDDYKAVIKQFSEDVTSFATSFHDDASVKSNWGHQYFCNDDGGRLIFDLNKPHEHVCCVCNKVYKGQPYDGVWTYMYRNEAIVEALKAATLYYYTKDNKYREMAMKIIGFYSDNYKNFVIHNKEDHEFDSIKDMDWGCGKIMPQGLNESILTIRIVQSLELIQGDELKDFIEGVKKNLLYPMVELLVPQVNMIHNIRVWNIAAIGAVALYCDDSKLFDWCYNSEFGVRAQLNTGVTEDGFWFEGSIHYNFFLLEGMISLMMLSEVYNHPFEEKEKTILNHMLERAYMYAFDNDILPNPNDGWPNLNLKTFSYVYHMAARVFGEESNIGNIIKLIENGDDVRTTLPLSESIYSKNGMALERLLFNTDFDYSKFTKINRTSYNYQKSNFAMLKNDKLNLFVKYGLNGPSHAHPDVLNIEVAYKDVLISRDISNAGYQSALCNKWHRKTFCHNTVICGGDNITTRSPGEAKLTDNKIVAFHSDVYENIENQSFTDHTDKIESHSELFKDIDYKRECVIHEDGFEDTFSVSSHNKETKDYIFHIESQFNYVGDLELLNKVDNLGYDNNGYQYLENIVEINGNEVKLSNGSLELSLSFIVPVDGKLYMMKTMDNPVSTKRVSFLVRSNEENPIFKMNLKCKEF